MNFFQQLAATGDVDITLRIMGKNGKLTVNHMPGKHSSITKPLNFTGTPEELDEEFFKSITPQVAEVRGIISNVDDVKEQAKSKADKAASPAKKETPAKPKGKSKPEKKDASKKKPSSKKASAEPLPEDSLFSTAKNDNAGEETPEKEVDETVEAGEVIEGVEEQTTEE